MYPFDDLREVYGVNDDLIAQVIDDLLPECDRRYPPLNEIVMVDRIRTVEDLVRLIVSYPSDLPTT